MYILSTTQEHCAGALARKDKAGLSTDVLLMPVVIMIRFQRRIQRQLIG